MKKAVEKNTDVTVIIKGRQFTLTEQEAAGLLDSLKRGRADEEQAAPEVRDVPDNGRPKPSLVPGAPWVRPAFPVNVWY